MPTNRNALIRYRTIDKCLRNRYRRWTLNNLIEACSEALYEYEGMEKGVSRRTVQMDIQVMRSEKLGYDAPIEVVEKKYYTYSDPDYSIVNLPLSGTDLDVLNETVQILRQFKGFSHFVELEGTVQKLENKIYTETTQNRPLIDLEKNEQLRGLEYLDLLYQAVQKQQVLSIHYQSFKAKTADTFVFHPVILKEYRNRWFVLGVRTMRKPLTILALDRILSLESRDDLKFIPTLEFDPEEYFGDIIGVSKQWGDDPAEVILKVKSSEAPYLITKPIHPSQIVIEEGEEATTFAITVRPNFELEREILGFGDAMEVVSPPKLRNRIRERIKKMSGTYHLKED